jgi:hypothetical protein
MYSQFYFSLNHAHAQIGVDRIEVSRRRQSGEVVPGICRRADTAQTSELELLVLPARILKLECVGIVERG